MLPSIAAIYAHHVLHRTGTFETKAHDIGDMAARSTNVQSKGRLLLVAKQDGEYCRVFLRQLAQARPAYLYSMEDPIYLAPDLQRKGLDHALLAELLAFVKAWPSWAIQPMPDSLACIALLALLKSAPSKPTNGSSAPGST